ncbi:class I SAM-dependent methyltransferase [Sandarakinorhabdus sp.]|uniref:class I SAM-dependent methyltransferase n=1 Tax=Sandarakinorhabdus sp. TaxID=1916663 RepID=UPI00286E5ADE|nr:class I SAM-dependent methyltransferase [Sandarakinorhabdus sp.]
MTLYDRIGVDYDNLRRPDPRLAAPIHTALGNARRVLNVGAGTGSYEPVGRAVVALEPSAAMIAKRPPGSAPAVQGVAEGLPFDDASFDAAMAVLTVHHWTDKAAGLAELRRVTTGPIVIVSCDPTVRPWPVDYFPGLAALDDVAMPPLALFETVLGPVEITPLLVPHDCSDGFLYAWWRRPAAYLDPRIRSGSSSFWIIDGVAAGVARLADDLASGAWERRHADLLQRDALDVGYRLIVAR